MAWRKSWPEPNLDPDGTKRKLSPEHRSVWDDCLDLAEMGPVTGRVQVARGVMYTPEQLAAIFKTPEAVVRSAMRRFVDLEMLTEEGVVINWPKYQSEYQRQKGYRSKLHRQVTRVSDK